MVTREAVLRKRLLPGSTALVLRRLRRLLPGWPLGSWTVAMPPMPVILLAMLESRFWTVDQAVALVERLLGACQVPEAWITRLSLSRDRQEAEEAIRKGCGDLGIRLPEDYGEMVVGFVYLRFQEGQSGAAQVRSELNDVFDAFDGVGGLQPEGVQDLEAPEGSPEWARAKQLRDCLQHWAESCKAMQRAIEDPRLYERDGDLIEYRSPRTADPDR